MTYTKSVVGRLAMVATWSAVISVALVIGDPLSIGLSLFVSTSLLAYQVTRLTDFRKVDPLTGLGTRSLCKLKLKKLIEGGTPKIAVLFMDLDQFKLINDALGQESGDRVLRKVGIRLTENAPDDAIITRLGGDEFGMIFTCHSTHDAMIVAKSIVDAFKTPFNIEGYLAELGISIGVAMYPNHTKQPNELLRCADIAMYESKRTRTSPVLYSDNIVKATKEDLPLRASLRSALENKELILEYQPKIDLATMLPKGAEALVRWMHPTMGRMSPDKFIPGAEQQGMINVVTEWVLTTAIRDLIYMRTQGVPLASVSVNVSPYSIFNGDLVASIKRILEEHHLDPTSLMVEITETSMQVNSSALIGVLISLDALGVGVSIDDFGTGQSSLLYLKHLPTTEIKIDKSFIGAMTTNNQDLAIVKSLIQLAHDLGCQVCAEGVEDSLTLNTLKSLRCDMVQGYLMAEPLTVEQMIEKFKM